MIIECRYCGGVIPRLISSQSNTLVLHFSTDSSVAHDGFLIEYSFVPFQRGTYTHKYECV